MDDHVCSPPQHILGYTIRSHTRIYVSYLIPSTLELFVYIAQFVGDCAVSYEHFHNKQPDFGWATLSLILIPPVLTFILVLSSKDQWSNPQHSNRFRFLSYQIAQLLLFPFFSVYRFAKRLFWSIDALFHDENDEERMSSLEKAAECSTCELYHLIQAFGQSAPQIILQLYHMLTQDLYRNYQTTNAQAISLVFSAIDVAAITATYQRFESQRQVGRHYPWSPPQQISARRQVLEKNKHLLEECARRKRESEKTIASFPESDKIMANFKRSQSIDSMDLMENKDNEVSEPLEHKVQIHAFDETDNKGENETNVVKASFNATDDDKIKEIQPKPGLKDIREEQQHLDDIEVLDKVPETPPPPCPKPNLLDLNATFLLPSSGPETPLLRSQDSRNTADDYRSSFRYKRSSRTRSQFETIADMLLVDAQLFIQKHVPHPPQILVNKLEPEKTSDTTNLIPSSPNSPPASPKDEVDFFAPRPTRIVNGIQQDDFAGRTIAFFGWISFITMRMLSLASFCVFFPKAFFILISCHYAIMLLSLWLESRFKGKLNRTLFYFLLAYVYIFVLMEFRIRFKHIKLWFVGYFIITMTENITMTMIWYAQEKFESWWFGFIFEGIIYSGILFVATLLTYYFILKPKDVMLLVDDDLDPNKQTNS